MALGTGHGATLAFTGTDSVLGAGPYLIRDLQLWDETGEAADLSHLGSEVFREYAAPDLYSLGPFNFNVLFDTELPSILPGQGTPQFPLPNLEGEIVNSLRLSSGMRTVVLTLPLRDPANNNTPATFSGLAAVLSRNFGSLVSNQEHLCPVNMQWQTHPQWAQERTVE